MVYIFWVAQKKLYSAVGQRQPRIVADGQSVKGDDGDGVLVILSDRVCVAERIEFDAVQIRGTGGEIADISGNDVPSRVQIQPEHDEVFSGGSGRRAVKRGRAVVTQKGAVDADVDIRRLEHFGEKQAACRIRSGEKELRGLRQRVDSV